MATYYCFLKTKLEKHMEEKYDEFRRPEIITRNSDPEPTHSDLIPYIIA
jgi:hypothetical protein